MSNTKLRGYSVYFNEVCYKHSRTFLHKIDLKRGENSAEEYAVIAISTLQSDYKIYRQVTTEYSYAVQIATN